MEEGGRVDVLRRVGVESELNPTVPPHFPMGYLAFVPDLRRCQETRVLMRNYAFNEQPSVDASMLKRKERRKTCKNILYLYRVNIGPGLR